jgi:CBS-domain-containing membrane protein
MPSFKRAELLIFLLAALGGGGCIFLLASTQAASGLKLVIPPFGASCVLVFLLPDSPLAQPRNVIGGHLISTLMGLIALKLCGSGALAEGLGVGLAILAMALTRTAHPPAGADPLVVIAAGAGWKFLASPVLAGALLVVGLGLAYHGLATRRPYPLNALSLFGSRSSRNAA